ncbi:MAG: DUF2769 domain-containing protein [Candidatus Lokiarchaeota archaeon]|nr:DUF2769 domain-containing protein [Candidatus Lokiarchaeota archaeon]
MAEEKFIKASFEEKMEMLYGKMTEKQMEQNIEQVMFTCEQYCGRCPSYKGTGEISLAFCMTGKSSEISEKKDCLCTQCPIYKTMSLRWEYYCTSGSALELSQSEK